MSAPIFHVVELLPGVHVNPAAVALVHEEYACFVGAGGFDRKIPVVKLVTGEVLVIEDGRTLSDVLRLLGHFDFVSGRAI